MTAVINNNEWQCQQLLKMVYTAHRCIPQRQEVVHDVMGAKP